MRRGGQAEAECGSRLLEHCMQRPSRRASRQAACDGGSQTLSCAAQVLLGGKLPTNHPPTHPPGAQVGVHLGLGCIVVQVLHAAVRV